MPRALRFWLCLVLAAGFTLAARAAAAQPVLDRLTRADGLPSDYVQGLWQDREGFVWMGTDAGVVRYDGERVETFTTDDGLPHPLVYTVVQDADGTVWAGTYGGVARFDGRRFVPEPLPLPRSKGYALMLDARGRLLVRGMGVAVREGPGRWRVWHLPPGDAVQTVLPLPDGLLLVQQAAPDVRLLRLRPSGRTFAAEAVRLSCTAPISQPSWALVAPGRYGVACGDGVYPASVQAGRLALGPRQPLRLPLPTHFLPDGSALAYTPSQVVWLPLRGAPVSVVPARAEAVLTDYEGTTWIGTFGKGVWRFRALHLRRLTRASTLRLARDGGGAVWATAEDGVWRVGRGDTAAQRFRAAPAHPYLRALAVRGTNLAAVSSGGYVWTFPGAAPKDVAGSWVSGLDAATDTLYASSYGQGLVRLYDGRRDTLRAGRGLPDNVLEDVVRLPSGLWLLTRSAGALRLRPRANGRDTVEVLGRAEGLPSSSIFGLYETARGVRYVGTDRGIARIAPGERAHVLGADALRGRRVVAFFERPRAPGVVWAVADRMLVRIEGREVQRLAAFALAPAPSASVTAAVYEPSSDRLFLATTEGLVAADLSGLAASGLPPPRVALRGVTVDGQPADGTRHGDTLALPDLAPGTHRVEVRVAPLSFVEGTEAEYRVNEGAWSSLGTGRVLVLPDVGHGRYRVEVRATNAEGRRSKTPVVLAFAVQPFLWQRPWAWVLAALALAALGWRGARGVSLRRLRARVARLEAERERQRDRERLSRDLHDHVGGQLTALVSAADLIGEAARRGDGTRVQTYADAVSIEARSALGQLRQTVVALRQQGLPATDLFRQLQEQAQSQLRFVAEPVLAARFHPATPEDETRVVPADVVFQTMQVAREAMTNVARHARARTAALTLSVEAGQLRLEVTDDGVGFDAARAHTGSGLDILRARAEEVNAALAFETGPDGRGTRVAWTVPLPP